MITVGLLAAGVAGGVAGAVLNRLRSSVAGDRNAFTLPPATNEVPPIPPAVQPAGVALPPFVTPNADFYRIDTALAVPQVSRNDWRLKIHGMVDHELDLGFADLDRFEVVEQVVTLTCVSNPVGGDLVSTAKWTRLPRPGSVGAGWNSSRRRHGVVDVDRRLHRGYADRGTDRRPRRAARHRHERRTATHRTRLPGKAGGARPVRVRVSHQVDRRPRTDQIRSGQGLLDPAGLVRHVVPSRPSRASTYRAAARSCPAVPSPSEGWRGPRIAAVSARSSSASTTARGRKPRWALAIRRTPGGCGASRGRPTLLELTRSGCGPPTRRARSRPLRRPT